MRISDWNSDVCSSDLLDKLKSCAALVESELSAGPVCPHCQFRPSSEKGDLLPAANVLKQLDEGLDKLLENWVQTLVENIEDQIIQSNFELLKASSREIVIGFAEKKSLTNIVPPEFVSAVKEALTGLAKRTVTGQERKK